MSFCLTLNKPCQLRKVYDAELILQRETDLCPGEAADSSPAAGADRCLQPAGPGQGHRARRGRCDALPATSPGLGGWPGDAGSAFSAAFSDGRMAGFSVHLVGEVQRSIGMIWNGDSSVASSRCGQENIFWNLKGITPHPPQEPTQWLFYLP